MEDARLIALALTDAVVREDGDAIHLLSARIEAEQAEQRVMASLVGLLASALVNAHGPDGALSQVDYVRAQVLGMENAQC